MAENMNPATMGGARVVAKEGKLATPSIAKNGAHVIGDPGFLIVEAGAIRRPTAIELRRLARLGTWWRA